MIATPPLTPRSPAMMPENDSDSRVIGLNSEEASASRDVARGAVDRGVRYVTLQFHSVSKRT